MTINTVQRYQNCDQREINTCTVGYVGNDDLPLWRACSPTYGGGGGGRHRVAPFLSFYLLIPCLTFIYVAPHCTKGLAEPFLHTYTFFFPKQLCNHRILTQVCAYSRTLSRYSKTSERIYTGYTSNLNSAI